MTNKLYNFLTSGIAIFAVTVSIVTLLWTNATIADTKKNKVVLQELMLIYTADYGQGEQVYTSSFANGRWTIPLQLSDSKIYAFHPVVAVGDNNKWAVWTQVDEDGKYLYYSLFNQAAWSKGERISTQTTENNSPILLIDGTQKPLLAWVGADGKYSDIYLTHWQGSSWGKPVLMNTVNNVPDIKPYFFRDINNRVVLSWLTFIDGKYSVTSRILDDELRVIARLPVSEKFTSSDVHKRVRLPELPEFVKDLKKGSFFIKTSTGSGLASLNDY